MTIELAPSILSANFARLGEDAKAALDGGGTVLHCDVMDGHFVPNITIGPLVVASLSKALPIAINVTVRDMRSTNGDSGFNSKATTQWRKTASFNGIHREGVASDKRSRGNGNNTTKRTSKEAKLGKVIRHTLGPSLNLRHNLP